MTTGSGHCSQQNHRIYAKYIKRGIDIAVSCCMLLLTAPINLVLALLTYKDVGSPIFFSQDRIWKSGVVFKLVKFSNMTNVVDDQGCLLPPEELVTIFGKIMRASSLDELFNFWSILKGDMSLIGPRPLLPEYQGLWSDDHLTRLKVRPGLECPNIEGNVFDCSWEEQFNNDSWYAQNVSFVVDARLFIRLVAAVFDKQRTKARGSDDRGYFIGYWDGVAVNEHDFPNWRECRPLFPAREHWTREEAMLLVRSHEEKSECEDK